ncbi:3,4-dihydroxy-2-butanone 4-phosphate synthase [Mycobacterium sp. JS623]|uniref:3,4-dihydroxy-2-butanone-4-phosphate synthase n=1 Tax=Mycobacterium sp. JS623 TaxID=212767 RepID=UPI0002A57914|nr:3,4-dihydroxy-2-butanone-4-phosphate synthase [Mycobacterium sp. JS623]AGB22206.1 3,4-dihydroxy-2-butanone 4-phosphate synthase [Mycobacterium sp. JS623]
MNDPLGIQAMPASIARAVADLAAGRPVVLVSENRQDRGYLAFAAEHASPAVVSFGVRFTSGFLRVALTPDQFVQLDLPLMVNPGPDVLSRFYTVTVDAAADVTTGISATDRATTIRRLASETTAPSDLTRPGHVLPVCAVRGGLLRRPGFTEAAVDLAVIAGLRPAAALGELVTDAGSLMDSADLTEFCRTHDLAQVFLPDLVAYRRSTDTTLVPLWRRSVGLAHGDCMQFAFGGRFLPVRHDAFVFGEFAAVSASTPLAVHHECISGDVVGAVDCQCRAQLDQALAAMAKAGQGILVHVGSTRYMAEFSEANYYSHAEAAQWFHPPDDAVLEAQGIFDLHQRLLYQSETVANDIRRYLLEQAAISRTVKKPVALGARRVSGY